MLKIILVVISLFPLMSLASTKVKDQKNICYANTVTWLFCKKVDAPDNKALCKALALNQRSNCFEIKQPDQKKLCLSIVPETVIDLKGCAEVVNPATRSLCDGLAWGSQDKCDEIKDENLRLLCLGISGPNQYYCHKIK